MLVIDGGVHEFQALPLIFFGRQKPLAYVVNPKAASTASHNFIFYVNHGYRYFDAFRLWDSHVATLRIGGTEFLPDVLDQFLLVPLDGRTRSLKLLRGRDPLVFQG